MVRFDFECQHGHLTTLWSDEARFCATCGSEFLKKVILDLNVGTKPVAKVDNLVRKALEEQGITNIQGGGHEGEREKITRKTTPEQLQADKLLRDFPALKDPRLQINNEIVGKWNAIGPQGVIQSHLGKVPGAENTKSALAQVKGMMPRMASGSKIAPEKLPR